MTEKDRIQIQVLLDRDVHAALVKLANKSERSLAGLVRFILTEAIKETP